MLRLIPRIEECKECPWWYNDNDIIGCTVPRYHKFDTLPPCTCTITKPSMNIIPNEDKMNLPIVTPLNLIGDEMKCKDCRFITDNNLNKFKWFCKVDHDPERAEPTGPMPSADLEKTACWKFKLPIVDKPTAEDQTTIDEETKAMLQEVERVGDSENDLPYHDTTPANKQTRDNFGKQMNAGQPIIAPSELDQLAEIAERSSSVDKLVPQTVQAVIGDAVEIHYRGLHRVEYMINLPNGIGAAVLTGPDGISRLLTQNECYFIKRVPKEGA